MLPDDFEDAFTPLDDIQGVSKMRFAIADGATESSFSKEWAQLLTRKFGSSGFDVFSQEILAELSTTWEEGLNKENLSWYNQEKFTMGSHASLLGVEIDLSLGTYSAKAVGDCCVMLVRDGQIINSFPIENTEDFSNHPVLIGTRDGTPQGETRELFGKLNVGDLLVLASDALAAWILANKDTRPWKNFLDDSGRKDGTLLKNFEFLKKLHDKKFPDHQNYFLKLALGDKHEQDNANQWLYTNWVFHNIVVREREVGRLKNDDSTLCLIQF